MGIDKSELDQINKSIENPTPKYDTLGGYEALLAGIAKNLPDIYGDNTAKNFVYQLGANPGRTIATRILEENEGACYDNPADAVINLIIRLKAYYSMEIVSIESTEEGEEITLFLTSYLDVLFDRRTDINRDGILWRVNKGYFESALQILTGKRIIVDYIVNEEKRNKIKITFK